MDAAATTDATNADKRWDDMQKAQKILMNDAGVVPIYQLGSSTLKNPKVKGVANHVTGPTTDYKWAYVVK